MWVGRTARAHLNLVENLAPFAILVLVAHVTHALLILLPLLR